MLFKIILPFESSRGLHYNFYSSSLMQGVMMEKIPPFYAEKMHSEGLRPYSQFCTYENGRNIWTVSALSREACENIIAPLLQLDTAELRHNNDILTFSEPLTEELSYIQLVKENAAGPKGPERISLDFITPTAFKSAGKYVILPTVRLIFQNLAKRFDKFYFVINNNYDSFAEETEKYITVTDYSLKSTNFSLEGVRIPAFCGTITFHVKGDADFRSYIRILCRFAEFSGIGIKTAIGMGQVKAHI